MIFNGYYRQDGRVGIRNYLAIMSTVMCANEVTEMICSQVKGAVPIIHGQGCCQMPPDLRTVASTLAGLGKNPNVGAVILVSLGCEGVDPHAVAAEIKASGKPVATLVIHDLGGIAKTVAQGTQIGIELLATLGKQERQPATVHDLVVGIKCGSSDTLSGLLTNPTTGLAVDKLIDQGGRVVFGEITEMIGAEEFVLCRTQDEKVKSKILTAILDIEDSAKRIGEDMREGQPTPGNIKGGLTTIEEKSLGAVEKSGSRPIDDFIDYGAQVGEGRLTVLDSPGREPELLTGLAAAGAQLIIFTTGRGAPQGFPICPVIKVTANERTFDFLGEFIDLGLCIGQEIPDLDQESDRILELVQEVSNGKLTKAEINKYDRHVNIYVKGPII
ncbi:MAG: UxaA family hydrolase [Negativicutes bacterium]